MVRLTTWPADFIWQYDDEWLMRFGTQTGEKFTRGRSLNEWRCERWAGVTFEMPTAEAWDDAYPHSRNPNWAGRTSGIGR